MRITTSVLAFIITLFWTAVPSFAQKMIRADKTTAEGRTILTSATDYVAGRDDKISLNYFSHGDTEVFQLKIDFDESGKRIKEGYKMLLKQKSGNIIELTCFSGEHKESVSYIPFIWMYSVDSFENANFLLSREQVLSIIDDPVLKMRMEYDVGYFDIGLRTPDGSRLSSYVNKAYKEIEKALQTTKTGLYDGF